MLHPSKPGGDIGAKNTTGIRCCQSQGMLSLAGGGVATRGKGSHRYIVAQDQPTSHQRMQDDKGDEFTGRMLGAINSMLVEVMAANARKDYEQHRERRAQCIENAKAAGKHLGCPVENLNKLEELLNPGLANRATALAQPFCG